MSKYLFSRICLIVGIVFALSGNAGLRNEDTGELARTWANTKMSAMSLEEKLGQLLMIQAFSNKGKEHEAALKRMIQDYHVGGVAFFQGTPLDQALLTMEMQSISKIPLLIAIDAEWGLGMRLEQCISFPKQMTLGAIEDNKLIYDMGREIGKELKSIGVHLNFAPVADINTRADNPVIHDRSFGQDKKNVSRKSYAYMKGLQDEGIMACAKHFPGHGSTDRDSHKVLPTVSGSLTEISEEELFPFKLLFRQGIKSVMVGHLQVPALDNRPARPASLSVKIVDELIRQHLQYKGLIITDALEMRGVADHFSPGEMEVEAFLAGNDILTVSQSIPIAHNALVQAVRSGRISLDRLHESLVRILVAKFEAGLFFPPEIDTSHIAKKLNDPRILAMKENLFRHALTYLPGQGPGLPITSPSIQSMATLSIGASSLTPFQKRVSSYTMADHYQLPHGAKNKEIERIRSTLKKYEVVLISLHNMNKNVNKQFGLQQPVLEFLRKTGMENKCHLVVFGSPYSLALFNPGSDILLGYEEDPMAQDLAAQAVFGSINIQGKLPVTVREDLVAGDGRYVPDARILAYSQPEFVGLSSDTLDLIEDIVSEMIDTGAAPGCQVLIAREGQIVYDRVFGYHTYDKKRQVRHSDVYDLASVTKIMATTLATMRLYEQGKLDIFDPISAYVDGYVDHSDKAGITILEALSHHAALKPWIPFYRLTLDTLPDRTVVPSSRFYRKKPEGEYMIKVAEGLYITRSYADSMSRMIYQSELRENKDYRYSDLGLYMIRDVVDAVAGKSLDQYLQDEFYQPLGLARTGFNPLDRIPKDEIVPSEEDDYFRFQRLQGYVHDMGAGMLGGVSGHAGLFSNAKDLAVLMQMLLNQGVYGKKKYFDHRTIYTFTTRYQRSSRRGIGFDMKELDRNQPENMSALAPASTFGHTGFTGTCVYGDPDHQIVFVFLSNRTYPTMMNNLFGKENYRSRIQSLIYRAFVDKL